jgi:flagellar biosynthetic protein FlhB
VRTESQAPVVVAKGMDLLALKIRSVAEAHGIPVVEDKLLARSLYDKVEVDQLIPPEFYRAVANVILYIMSRGKPMQAGGASR